MVDQDALIVERLSFPSSGVVGISDQVALRKVSENVYFMLTLRQSSLEKQIREVESIVAPYQKNLFDLFFKFVHPAYPIVSESFVSDYVNHRETSPALLAAIFALALHWVVYDSDIPVDKAPNASALDRLAYHMLQDNLHQADLSFIQAGLLLLQRKPDDYASPVLKGNTQTWAFTTQILGAAQALGLHLDCRYVNLYTKILRWLSALGISQRTKKARDEYYPGPYSYKKNGSNKFIIQ